jgi:uncharacterized protein (TIGR00266 family)
VQHEILYAPDHSVIKFILKAGESLRAESDAMVAMSDGIELKTGFGAGPKSGGILKNLFRSLVTGESFFTNVFTATDDGQEILFAPELVGDIEVAELKNSTLIIQATSYLLSSNAIAINSKWQGMKSFFSGESMFMIEASGTGFVALAAFGGIQEVAVDSSYIVDTGHIVAFTAGLSYKVTKASAGWIASFLSGEGLVCEFTGRGTVYIQSRNPKEYGAFVGPKLKPIVKRG